MVGEFQFYGRESQYGIGCLFATSSITDEVEVQSVAKQSAC